MSVESQHPCLSKEAEERGSYFYYIEDGVRIPYIGFASKFCVFLRKPAHRNRFRQMFTNTYSGVWVLSGHGALITPEGERYELEPGSFLQRIPFREHTTLVYDTDEWTELFLNLPVELYRAALSTGILIDQDVIYPGLSEDLLEEAQELVHVCVNSSPEDLPTIYVRELALLRKLMVKQKNRQTDAIDRQLSQAYQILCSNLQDNLHMEDVAKRVGMGYESFRKLFRARYNASPGQIRIQQKISVAKHQLRAGYRIQEVADMLGYCDEFAFSRQFSRIVGQSPISYSRAKDIAKNTFPRK